MASEKVALILLFLVICVAVEKCSCQFFTKTQKSIPRMGRSIDEVSEKFYKTSFSSFSLQRIAQDLAIASEREREVLTFFTSACDIRLGS